MTTACSVPNIKMLILLGISMQKYKHTAKLSVCDTQWLHLTPHTSHLTPHNFTRYL